MCINLVLADSHPVMLEGLNSSFQGEPDMQVNSCAHDGCAALDAVKRYEPDYVVMDLALNRKNGLDVIQEISAMGVKTRPIIFTSASISDVMRAIDLGVRGVVSKDKPKHALVDCIKSLEEGHAWLDEDLTMKAVTHLLEQQKKNGAVSTKMTSRELSVARLAMGGLSNKKIARQLSISEGTIKLHLHHIYQKLNCSGRMALAIYMQDNGLS
jgi:two-component system nitrate/nitrite response regulator NarL